MDSQLKERIIGAAVLVALGVWLIPWVLDGPAEDAPGVTTESGPRLPAAEDASPVRTEVVELTPSPPDAVPERRSPTAGDNGPASERQSPSAGAADDARSRSDLAARTPADSAPGSAADPAADESAAEGAVAATTRLATPTPERRDPAADSTPTRGGSDAGGWSVQLGAFSEAANARQLASRVEEFGYVAAVSDLQSGGRTLYRVRVEGFATREQAEAAQSSLAAHHFVAQVLAPE